MVYTVENEGRKEYIQPTCNVGHALENVKSEVQAISNPKRLKRDEFGTDWKH